MKNYCILLFFLVLSTLTLASCTQVKQKKTTMQDYSTELFQSHNSIRAKNGKSPLALNSKLTSAAQKHVEWMAKRGKLSHTGEGRSQPWDRAKKEDYIYSNCGENIAYGQPTVESVMKGWMRSRGHKANILGKYREVGFGVVIDEDGTVWWCVLFASP